jgi:amidohydrolase
MSKVDANELKHKICETIENYSDLIKKISKDIYENPELGFMEEKASALLTSILEKEGFEVERGIGGLHTAFRAARRGMKEEPAIAILAEYDALPDIGHACGHNLIAAVALGAALGVGRHIKSIPGKLWLYGTPAEEKLGGKIAMVENDFFNEIDAAMMAHPRNHTWLRRRFLACVNMDVEFAGKASHAAAAPEKGINALDAAINMFVATASLKKHLRDEVRINGIISEGGTAVNIVPERAVVHFSIRAHNRIYLQKVIAGVQDCAKAGAMAARAGVNISIGPVCAEMNDNLTLISLLKTNMEKSGFLIEDPPMEVGGSTDMGNVSWKVPAIHPFFQVTKSDVALHSRDFQKISGTEEANSAAINMAKAIAMTCVDLFGNRKLLEEAKREFQESLKAVNEAFRNL